MFRWFVGLAIEDPVWNDSVFSKSCDRLIEHDAVTELFNATVEMVHKRGLLSGEHFSVDGTLIQARASHKRLPREDGPDPHCDVGPQIRWWYCNGLPAARAAAAAASRVAVGC